VNGVWGRSLALLVMLGLACLVLWPVAGAGTAWAVFACGLLFCIFLHLRHVSLLLKWLRTPALDAMPQGVGIWDEVFAALYRMLRQRSQSESRLSATLKDFQQAGAAMPDGLVILDQADRIEWCNPKAELHLGLDLRRDTGQQITYLVRNPRFSENLRAQNYSEPLILRQSRGSDLILSVQLVPYGDRQTLVISRDVTDLERVETMRRDFIANVSHELRTPLTVVGGFLETISDARPTDGELLRRSLPLMMDQTRRMQRLVEDLLTLSRLESANNPVREEHVNVPDLAQALYRDALALSAGRHRIRLELESRDWLSGSEDEQGDVAAFRVRDSGIGINPEHIPRLTERFYRVDRSRSRETGGTGLGLAIVKHVLNRHQGWLEVASEAGRGSTFTAVLPAQRLLPAGPVAEAALAKSA
jgi:two-component system, OmpR family, phosphate regulon sensor histidine kinase PhoR